jgi:aminopeptidase-like protein
MKSDLIGQKLPGKYRNLLESIWYLNRVHNGPEQLLGMKRVADFAKKELKGDVLLHSFQAGESANFWTVPKSWVIQHFTLTGPRGNIIATEKDHPLVVCPFSNSVDVKLKLSDLKKHVISDSSRESAYIFHFRQMYRHWENDWAISLPHKLLSELEDGEYHVKIFSQFENLPMPAMEYHLAGKTNDTICLVAHFDHPAMVNDSLSGCLALIQALEILEQSVTQTRYSYRLILVPEHIGSVIWLSHHKDIISSIHFVLSANMTAHNAPLAMCCSKSGGSMMDLALKQALEQKNERYLKGEFQEYPDCGDEICFDTVGLSIPSTTISRTGEMFKEYHTSEDNLNLFLQEAWQKRHQDTVQTIVDTLKIIETNATFVAKFEGLPCLSHPELNLYLSATNLNNIRQSQNLLSSHDGVGVDARAFMEFFLTALSDEKASILELAAKAGLPYDFVKNYAESFEKKGLIELVPCSKIYQTDLSMNVALGRGGLI